MVHAVRRVSELLTYHDGIPKILVVDSKIGTKPLPIRKSGLIAGDSARPSVQLVGTSILEVIHCQLSADVSTSTAGRFHSVIHHHAGRNFVRAELFARSTILESPARARGLQLRAVCRFLFTIQQALRWRCHTATRPTPWAVAFSRGARNPGFPGSVAHLGPRCVSQSPRVSSCREPMLTRAWRYQPHAHYYSGHFESGNIWEKESKDNGIPPHTRFAPGRDAVDRRGTLDPIIHTKYFVRLAHTNAHRPATDINFRREELLFCN